MAEGREELFLAMDASATLRAARAVDSAMAALERRFVDVARSLDAQFDRAWAAVRSGAASAARFAAERFHSLSRSLADGLRGALSVAFGNLLSSAIASVLGQIGAGVRSFLGSIVDQGRAAGDAMLFLANATRESGGDFARAREQATLYAREVGISVTEAQRLFATANLGLQGTGIDPGAFLTSAGDLLASRGRSLGELQEVIGQLFAGSDEGIGRLLGGGENPSTIWEAYAASVGRAASSLTDLEKKQAVVNTVMARASGQVGAAGERVQTLYGRLDQIGALIDEISGKVGQALGRNAGVSNVLDTITNQLLAIVSNEAAFESFLAKVANGVVDIAEVLTKGVIGAGVLFLYAKQGISDVIALIVGIREQALSLLDELTLRIKIWALDLAAFLTEKLVVGVLDAARRLPLVQALEKAYGPTDPSKAFAPVLSSFANASAAASGDLQQVLLERAIRDASRTAATAVGQNQTLSQVSALTGLRDPALEALQAFRRFAAPPDPANRDPLAQFVDRLRAARAQVRQVMDGLRADMKAAFEEISKAAIGNTRDGGLGGNRFVAVLDDYGKTIQQFQEKFGKLAPDFFQAFKAEQDQALGRTLDKLRDENANDLRSLSDLANRLRGVAPGPLDSDLNRLFNDALGLSGSGFSPLRARQQLLDRALGGQIDLGRITGGQEAFLRELVAERQRELSDEERNANQALESERRRQIELAERQLKATEAQLDLFGIIGEAIRTAEAAGVTKEKLAQELAKILQGGGIVKVQNEITINSEEVFTVDVADGSAVDRLRAG